jgi:HAD superfamily hydrolase (TIGR01509 family)
MSSHPNIQAILFDLDGTLRHSVPEGFDAYLQYLTELGHPLNAEQRRQAQRWNHYYWAISPDYVADVEAFGADTRDFWIRHSERLLDALSVDGDDTLAARMHDLMRERHNPVHYIPDDVRPTLTRLRAAGYTVALVSNRTEALGPFITELGLHDLFDFTLSAGQANAWKPAPEIFLKAAELARCAPGCAVYVGDNYYADIEGALGAGMRPVLIDPRGLFPEAACPVIRAIHEIEQALIRLGTSAQGGSSDPQTLNTLERGS